VVAFAGGVLAFLLPGGLADGRGEPGPGRQLRRRGEPGHVQPHLGDDHLGGGDADARDRVQAGHRRSGRGDLVLDPGLDLGDVSVDRVDPGEHLGQQERVVVGEPADERLLQASPSCWPPPPRRLPTR
jgi:hypothetical protein